MMCYYVLKQNGKVIARSTIRTLTKVELLDPIEIDMRSAFDHAITKLYSAFDESLVHNASLDDMMDPMYPNDMDDEEEAHDDKVQNAEIISGPDEFINAQIYLPHGDWNEIARVLGQKRNLDGLYLLDENTTIPSWTHEYSP